MTRIIRQIFGLVLMFFSIALFAQSDRPSCVIMKSLDLKSLLGADHDAPVPFGDESCRAESNAPGRLVILNVMEQKPAELKSWLANTRKLMVQHRAKEATIVAEPAVGPDAFSVRDRDMRSVEFYALKGSRAVVIQGSWPFRAPLNDTGIKQFQQLAKSVLDKLP